jgi:ArsR family transcriptional regulator, arsenate/arsenite/antimonite-responsive transcriptional repressor
MNTLPEIFKALGDENRLRVLHLLLIKELCVCELETILNLTQSNVSRHLNKLKNTGIVSSEKSSQWVHYRVDQQFKTGNTLLIDYVKAKLDEPVYQKDLKRFQCYQQSNFTCEQINKTKSKIVAYLNEFA